MKLNLIKFLVGGLTVVLTYLLSKVIPVKAYGGIFAAFPAVFLISMYVAGLQYGRAMAMHVSKGAIFGMIGVLCSMLATWGMLATTHMWLLSIVVGFIVWFISAFLLFEIGEKFFRHKHTHHYKH